MEFRYGDLNYRGNGGEEMGDYLPWVNLDDTTGVVAVIGGDEHNCAILMSAEMKCWGANNRGFHSIIDLLNLFNFNL